MVLVFYLFIQIAVSYTHYETPAGTEKKYPPHAIFHKKHKKDFAAPDAILIDDRESNIIGWIENGGEGILHTSAEETIKTLIEKYNLH